MVWVDWGQAAATGHVMAAVLALLAGASVLLLPKGTRAHKALGAAYVVALVVVNVAALSLHRENAFGVFHVLAVISLVTVAVGIAPLLVGWRSPPVLAIHAYCVTWSYAGLAAAGFGQAATAAGQGRGWVVLVVIALVLSLSGVVIVGKVPSSLDRTIAN